MIDDISREYFQNERIGRTRTGLGDVKHHQENLRGEVEKLHLVVEAMWKLLKMRTGLSDKELVQMMNEVDAADGQLDGKSTKDDISTCNGCGKVLQKGIPTCMYCGLSHQISPFENR